MKIDFDAVSAKYKTLQEKEQVNASRPIARLPSRAFRALLPLYTLKKMISACCGRHVSAWVHMAASP